MIVIGGAQAAAYLLVVTFVGLAMGPYTIGQLSDAFGLRTALLSGLAAKIDRSFARANVEKLEDLDPALARAAEACA